MATCPLKFSTHPETSIGGSENDCTEGECAWWQFPTEDEKDGVCVTVGLAKGLDQIDKSIYDFMQSQGG